MKTTATPRRKPPPPKSAAKRTPKQAGKGGKKRPAVKKSYKRPGSKLLGTVEERLEKFCTLVVAGQLPLYRCYQEAGYQCDRRPAETGASRMLRKAEVQRRVAQLRETVRAQMEEALVMTIREKREFLAAIVRTPLSQIGPDSVLCAEYRERFDEEGNMVERIVKKVPAQFALPEDSRLAGHYEPDELNVSTTFRIVDEIRNQRDY